MSTETLVLNGLDASGPTANRPTAKASVGQPYFDTDLGQQLVWNGSDWLAVGVGSGDLLMPIVNRFAVDAEALTELAEWVLLYGEQLIAYEDGAAVAIYYGAGVLVDGVPTGPALSELTPWEPGGGPPAQPFAHFLPLDNFRILSSGAIPASGGGAIRGYSDGHPYFAYSQANGRRILLWNNAQVQTIQQNVQLPVGFDGTKDYRVRFYAQKLLAQGDTPAFSVVTVWSAGATIGSPVTDSTANLADTTNIQTMTATIAASEILDTAEQVTVEITPGTHDTDFISAWDFRLEEVPA